MNLILKFDYLWHLQLFFKYIITIHVLSVIVYIILCMLYVVQTDVQFSYITLWIWLSIHCFHYTCSEPYSIEINFTIAIIEACYGHRIGVAIICLLICLALLSLNEWSTSHWLKDNQVH